MDKESLLQRIARASQGEQGLILPDHEPLVPAAVLIPLIERPSGMHILLTRRTEHLRRHPGQISFPGGRMESDESVEAAALRESQEEIGLPPERVEIIGRLGSWRVTTGFIIYPVVGIIQPPVRLKLDPREVAEIFELPLSFLLDPKNHKPHIVEYGGKKHELIALPYGDYFIWGATAGMLHRLYRTLAGESV